MKKVFSILLVVMLTLGALLTGCGSTSEKQQLGDSKSSGGSEQNASEKVIELKYWVPFSGGDGEFMAALVDEFNKTHEDVKVEMLNIKWEDYYTKLRTSLVSNTGPDVAIAHTSKLAELAPTGMLTDIETLAKDSGIDWAEFSENTLNATVMDGKHFAVPLDTHAVIMYYNKDYLGKAGLLDEKGNIIMEPGVDGFINMLKKLKTSLPEGVFPFASSTNNVYPFWIWYALYSQIDNGGKYIDNGKAAFNNEAARKALQVLVDMRDEGLWPKNVTDASGYDLFKSGKSAVNFAGVWATGNYEQNKELNFGAVPMPVLFDKPAAWGDSHTLVIPVQKDSAKQVEAAKFADWLTDNGAKWALAGHVPSKKAVLESKEYLDLKYRPDYAEVAKYVNHYPKSDKLWPCNDAMVDTFALMMNGSLTLDQAIEKAEEEVNNILSK